MDGYERDLELLFGGSESKCKTENSASTVVTYTLPLNFNLAPFVYLFACMHL